LIGAGKRNGKLQSETMKDATRLVIFLLLGSARAFAQTNAAAEKPETKPPPPFTSPAEFYSGISGAGEPVVGEGRGGWRSGASGVLYKGAHPKPGWDTNWGDHANGSAVKEGLIPPIKPLLELHLRDTVIRLGGDGNYYMTGSTGDNIWDRNDGVELWRSPDLKQWDYLGLVWSIERDGSWEKEWKQLHNQPARNVWAPEIYFIKSNYFIALCMAPGGCQILKSTTGKPEGPYRGALNPERPIAGGIDAMLFEDDDGKVYFSNGGGGRISLMKDDLGGIVESHNIQYEKPADGSWTRNSIAQEGVSLFKRDGTYYLGGAAFYKGRYSSVVAISTNIFGPYAMWHEAVPCGGGGNYLKDKQGNWWCTYFGNDDQSPFREKPAIVRIEFAEDGKILVAKKQRPSAL
jgi:xylan 1,4-beta-xylosidase